MADGSITRVLRCGGRCASEHGSRATRERADAAPGQGRRKRITGESPADRRLHTASSATQACADWRLMAAPTALHRWIARHRRWQSVLPQEGTSPCPSRGAARNGSRIQVRSFRMGVALAVAEDCLAPTHPNSSKTGSATPLVDAHASTGFEKVGEWMDPSCTDWARMEFAEPIPRTA